MRSRVLGFVCTLAAAALSVANAGADELLLKDGSRLLGTAVRKASDILEFKTSFAGVIKVEWAQVTELRTDQSAQVLLRNDEVIDAEVFVNRDGVTLVRNSSGTTPRKFDAEDIAFINPEPWRLGRGFRFSGLVNFALQTERGNTDEDEIDLDSNLLWRRRNDRFTLRGELEHDKTDGTTTKDDWKLDGEYDYFYTRKRFYGAIAVAESDDLAELQLRVGGGPGIGYQFFESEPLNLSVRSGLIRVYEDFKTQDNDRYWGLGWMVNADKYVLPRLFGSYHLQAYHLQRGLWNLYDSSDLVWDTWTGLRFPLVLGLVASTELQVEYDSGAAPGADEVDTTYTLKLGYQW
jgi:hypothetical protein